MSEPSGKKISLSIVSHGNQDSAVRLLEDLARLGRKDVEVILTINVPEPWPAHLESKANPLDLKLIRNAQPKGFAANHNAAFAVSSGENFVFLNPDIRLLDDPFDILLAAIAATPDVICAPLVLNDAHEVEDSARNYPSPYFLCKKLLGKLLGISLARDVIRGTDDFLMPDWVAGMFVMAPRAIYQELDGLSERYHLYYEDVDFCARARLAGYQIQVCKRATVIHQAQRASHRKLRYLAWHVQSACKFFTSAAYLRIQKRRLFGARP
ncbi:N/A [soil metagenome]